MTNIATIPAQPQKLSLLRSMAERYGMEAQAFEQTIRATVMPAQHSMEEFAACILVAYQHGLNPITREIFFMRAKSGGIQPIVSVDGWVTITNSHPKFDGMEFVDTFEEVDGKRQLASITCKIFRKDRTRHVEVTEYMNECRGTSPAWQKTPSRMLRHRAMIQCARYAFGFAGIMEHDEFEQWQGKAEHGGALKPTKSRADFEIPDDVNPPSVDRSNTVEASKSPGVSTVHFANEPLTPDGIIREIERALARGDSAAATEAFWIKEINAMSADDKDMAFAILYPDKA